MGDLIEVEVTCPDMAAAERVARSCVEARLAACANIAPGLRSLYRWQGRIEDEPELAVKLKTRAALFERLAAAVAAVHPYEVPAIVARRLVAATPAYAAWVLAETEGA